MLLTPEPGPALLPCTCPLGQEGGDLLLLLNRTRRSAGPLLLSLSLPLLLSMLLRLLKLLPQPGAAASPSLSCCAPKGPGALPSPKPAAAAVAAEEPFSSSTPPTASRLLPLLLALNRPPSC